MNANTVLIPIFTRGERRQKAHPLSADSEHSVYDECGQRYPSLIHFYLAKSCDESLTKRIIEAQSPYMAMMIGREKKYNTVERNLLVRGLTIKAILHLDIYQSLMAIGCRRVVTHNVDPSYLNISGCDYSEAIETVRLLCVLGVIQEPDPIFSNNMDLIPRHPLAKLSAE